MTTQEPKLIEVDFQGKTILVEDVGIRYNVVASFQYRENYAAHAWDGVGECPQGWKFKGGHDEIIACALPANEAEAFMADDEAVHALCKAFEYSDDYSSNELCGVNVVWEKIPTYDEEVNLSLDYGLRFDEATGLLVSEHELWEAEGKDDNDMGEEMETIHFCDSTTGCTGQWCKECGYHRTEVIAKKDVWWRK